MQTAKRPILLLCADDYALTEGVSRAIEDLARAGRLSATSVMTTTRHWPEHAARIARLRDRIAIGLHFNLTLGQPLGTMPQLAPEGRLPPIGPLTAKALRRAVDVNEVEEEADRQLTAFEAAIGHPPDFLDGHQHVHALPVIRNGVLAALTRRYPRGGPLVRDPGDSIIRIVRRSAAASKAMVLAALAHGLGRTVRRAGFATNDGFAGVSDFSVGSTERDFTRSLAAAGTLHLVMCHPGFVDDELKSLDPVTDRRRAEFDLLMRDDVWQQQIWHPARSADGPPIDWGRLGAITT